MHSVLVPANSVRMRRASRPADDADRRPRSREPRVLAVGLAFALVLTAIGFTAPNPAAAWDAGAFSSSSEAELVALTNQARANAGLKALVVDSKLKSLARARSKDMIVRDYFSHSIPPDGHSVFDEMSSSGYCFKLAGENIGWNNYPDDSATAAVHQAFMNSSGHRKNILGASWDVIGIGAYKGSDGKKMWTVIFADKCGSSATPKPTPKPTPKATPKPAPKATPKPTPKPTPAPTPPPTPKPTDPPDPIAPAILPVGPSASAVASPTGSPDRADRANTAAALRLPGAGTGGRGVGGDGPASFVADYRPPLRVADAPSTPGLYQSIVGAIAGVFFGG